MKRAIHLAVTLAACWLVTGGASAAPSDVAVAPDGPWSRFTPHQNGEVPSDIAVIAPSLVAIVDHVSGIVLFANGDGTERGRDHLPAGYRVGAVRNFPDRTVLIAVDGANKIVLPKLDQAPATLPPIRAVAVTANDPDVAAATFIKRDVRRAGVAPQAGAGVTNELKVRGIGAGALAAATFLGTDRQGRAYTLTREIFVAPIAQRNGAQRSEIQVTMTVGRHDRTGERTDVAQIPVNKLYKIPRGQYVTIDQDGGAVALLPMMDDNGKPIGVVLYRPVFVPEEPQVAALPPLAAAARTLRELQLSATQAVFQAVPNDSPAGLVVVDRDIPGDSGVAEALVRRTLPEMQRAAADIMGTSWMASTDNLAAGHQLDCDFDRSDANHAFELPHQLKVAAAGTEIKGIPYNWGGKGSIEQFRSELEQGYRAGNICSQVGRKLPRTTGLDCSGFVAQVWGVPEFGTARAHRYSVPIAGLDDLQWGDAFNKAGSHIRLFVGIELTPDEGMRINTIESTSACGGTCALSYHVEHFQGYEIRRLTPQ